MVMNKNEKYRSFKQLLNSFYKSNDEDIKQEKTILPHTIKLEPKLIYDTYNKNMKIEFKIGNKNMYVLKNLITFYDKMLNQELYEYGAKLGFVHTKDAFELESIPLLNFVLKYAEIIKYANETSKEYGVWQGITLSDRYITISNTGIDELFEVLILLLCSKNLLFI